MACSHDMMFYKCDNLMNDEGKYRIFWKGFLIDISPIPSTSKQNAGRYNITPWIMSQDLVPYPLSSELCLFHKVNGMKIQSICFNGAKWPIVRYSEVTAIYQPDLATFYEIIFQETTFCATSRSTWPTNRSRVFEITTPISNLGSCFTSTRPLISTLTIATGDSFCCKLLE